MLMMVSTASTAWDSFKEQGALKLFGPVTLVVTHRELRQFSPKGPVRPFDFSTDATQCILGSKCIRGHNPMAQIEQ